MKEQRSTFTTETDDKRSSNCSEAELKSHFSRQLNPNLRIISRVNVKQDLFQHGLQTSTADRQKDSVHT